MRDGLPGAALAPLATNAALQLGRFLRALRARDLPADIVELDEALLGLGPTRRDQEAGDGPQAVPRSGSREPDPAPKHSGRANRLVPLLQPQGRTVEPATSEPRLSCLGALRTWCMAEEICCFDKIFNRTGIDTRELNDILETYGQHLWKHGAPY